MDNKIVRKGTMTKDKLCPDCGLKLIMRKSQRCRSCDNRTRKRTEDAKQRISNANRGEKNKSWKGDAVGYNAIHGYIKRRKPKPATCECCGENKDLLDLANISGKYLRDLDDWEYLCRKCHITKDGRLNALIANNRIRNQKKRRITYGTKPCSNATADH